MWAAWASYAACCTGTSSNVDGLASNPARRRIRGKPRDDSYWCFQRAVSGRRRAPPRWTRAHSQPVAEAAQLCIFRLAGPVSRAPPVFFCNRSCRNPLVCRLFPCGGQSYSRWQPRYLDAHCPAEEGPERLRCSILLPAHLTESASTRKRTADVEWARSGGCRRPGVRHPSRHSPIGRWGIVETSAKRASP